MESKGLLRTSSELIVTHFGTLWERRRLRSIGASGQGFFQTHLADGATPQSPLRWGPPRRWGSCFLRADDAKQIRSLLQLLPAKLPGTFPGWGGTPAVVAASSTPCTNDNIGALFIPVLQGGFFGI